jgi:signal peptidase I
MTARGLLGAVTAAVIAVLLVGCGGHTRTYRTPSGAMEPALKLGERFTADLHARSPSVGDIVVFHPPAGADSVTPRCGDRTAGVNHRRACDRGTAAVSSQTFVKRVVAVGGDRISLRDGRVIRNGKPESGYRVLTSGCAAAQCDFPQTITVPAGAYYMLGDNRGASDDSRFWGPVPKRSIIGTVQR